MPANIPCLSFFLTVYEGLHTMVIEAVRFNQIDYVKLVNLILASV